ncbi:MAG: hypothetical protein WBN99_10765 [Mycobacterium sp.]
MAAVVSFHSACRFFSHYAWDTDRLGLPGARRIVDRLLDTDAPIEVAVDDTLFRRWEKRVHNAFWTHDDTAQGPAKLGRGNRWVIVGIVVRLPFCSHPVCLPILFRLWGGKDTASPTELDGAMLEVLAEAFPHKNIHAIGDAAYHRRPLLSPGTTIATGLPANAVLHRLAPSRTGLRGRPAKPATAGRGPWNPPCRVPRANPRHRLVHDPRLPPRRPHQSPRLPALVRPEDRARLRGHARQAPFACLFPAMWSAQLGQRRLGVIAIERVQ